MSERSKANWIMPDLDAQHMPPGLYMVATPIGNLGDITLRALHILERADVVVCEDTRMSGKLLGAYGLKKKLLTYNDHSNDTVRTEILARAAQGERIALISDAGMPMISDPGFKLAQDFVAQGLHVTSLPGANAPLMGVQLSGLSSAVFSFLGFLPTKAKARRDVLNQWGAVSGTLVAFESPNRLVKALADILDVCGDRQMAVARELTKLHEDVQRGPVSALMAHYAAHPAKGEIVLVIAGVQAVGDVDDADIRAALTQALQEMKTKDAARFVSEHLGIAQKRAYALALDIRQEGDDGDA